MNVHELEADLARVSRLQGIHHLAKLHFIPVAEERIPRHAIQIRRAQSELFDLQTRIVLRLIFERIDIRLRVTQRAVIVNQTHHSPEKRQVCIGCWRTGNRYPCSRCFLFTPHLGRSQLKPLKKCSPRGIDRKRVFAPLGILGFHQI